MGTWVASAFQPLRRMVLGRMRIHILMSLLSIIWGLYLELGLLDHMVILCLIFWGTSIPLSTVAFPPRMYRVPISPHPSPTVVLFYVKITTVVILCLFFKIIVILMGVLKIKIFKGTASTIWENHCSKELSGCYLSEPLCDAVYPPSTLGPRKSRLNKLSFPTTYPAPLGGLCQGPTPQQMYCGSSLPLWSLKTPLTSYIGDVPSGSSIQELGKVL